MQHLADGRGLLEEQPPVGRQERAQRLLRAGGAVDGDAAAADRGREAVERRRDVADEARGEIGHALGAEQRAQPRLAAADAGRLAHDRDRRATRHADHCLLRILFAAAGGKVTRRVGAKHASAS